MTRRTAAAAAAVLAALTSLGACTGNGATTSTADTTSTGETTTPSSDSITNPPSDEPIDLTQTQDDAALEPATYAVPLLAVDSPVRAIVDVPEGFASAFDGTVIGSADGDVAFWGRVTQVDADPCLGNEHVSAGTSVHDLAAALVAQRHMTISQPVPVTVGDYHGLYLKLVAPANLDKCHGGSVTIYTAGGPWLQWDVPGATFHEWILNVHGTRVVGGARIEPDAADSDELVGMVQSAEFSLSGH